ncbi:hypothetical protein PGT21_023574 [Puccinia graminis f. sp. tritici]|uniref:Uncharacterized protein n=1 Tax=Puccinia graminis f. sp. tritici TaxID=56615 RepID=A0A5B0MM97_PUCGR|nr:hypothetical protein PGT21_023574 [Puccinia graminis f. sp. tritici]
MGILQIFTVILVIMIAHHFNGSPAPGMGASWSQCMATANNIPYKGRPATNVEGDLSPCQRLLRYTMTMSCPEIETPTE